MPIGDTKRKRVLSGMRPTGRLHIGHYFGALANWVKLQNDPAYECFYFIADWHALTSDYADTSQVAQNTIEIAIDFIASGLDPEKSTIFVQSQVPEHAELDLLLGMITPLGWLERVPTYKEALDNIQGKDLHMYGFLGYPVLQTADIVVYGEPDRDLVVPVGEDQVAHVELSREIVRRFNDFMGVELDPLLLSPSARGFDELLKVLGVQTPLTDYVHLLSPQGPELSAGAKALLSKIRQAIAETGIVNVRARLDGLAEQNALPSDAARRIRYTPILREPDVMLTHTPRIPGTDGRKMSKSYGNTVMFADTDEAIWEKIRPMVTDPARKRRTDPGDPDVCPVYDWHKLFSPPETLQWSASGCRSAAIGCIECKRAMADNLIKWIAPVRERRREFESHPSRVLQILDAGSKRARTTAVATMERVREAVFGWKQKRAEIAQSQNISSAGTKA